MRLARSYDNGQTWTLKEIDSIFNDYNDYYKAQLYVSDQTIYLCYLSNMLFNLIFIIKYEYSKEYISMS